MFFQVLKSICEFGNVIIFCQAFLDDYMQQGIQQGDVHPGFELQHVIGMAGQVLTSGVHDDQGCAVLMGVLDERGGDRMVLRRAGANHDDHVGMPGCRERRGDGA